MQSRFPVGTSQVGIPGDARLSKVPAREMMGRGFVVGQFNYVGHLLRKCDWYLRSKCPTLKGKLTYYPGLAPL